VVVGQIELSGHHERKEGRPMTAMITALASSRVGN